MASYQVPVVDISSWKSGTSNERSRVADEIGAAFGTGFFHLIGHEISLEVRERALEAMGEFFALSEEEKAITVPADGSYRGWIQRRSEGFAATLEQVTPADLVEGFVLGAEDRADANPGDPAFAPNLWPASGSLRDGLWDYYLEARALSEQLCTIAGLALGVDDGFFAAHIDHANVTMRANFYDYNHDDGELTEAQMALGAHTDYGMITVLLADPIPGLQVLNEMGEWMDLTPANDALIVNVGDAMALLTNDLWPSTIHRVIPARAPGGPPRRSLALFQDGNPDALIRCLEHCTSRDRPPRYQPTTLGAHVAAKVASSRTRALAATQQTTAGRLRPR